MNLLNIENKSCAVLRRSSSASQGTSICNQGKTIDSAIADHHLKVIYEEVLEGVSGSVPGNRTDIDRIIEQKRLYNHFDLLVVPDVSRFTRAGASHGSKLLYDLRASGLIVLFVAENIIVHDELTAMYVSFLLHAAHETAKAISRNGTHGSTQSFLAGRSPYSRRPPMGMDRMYALDGKDLFIIRNLADGTQQMLDPQTKALVRSFAKNQAKGVPNHYIKQKNEQVRLVLGDPAQIAKVLLIFHLHFIDKLSYRQIAIQLNDTAISSSLGKEWHTYTVRFVLLNPAYVGRGIRYRVARGIYTIGGNATATPSNVDLKELAEHVGVRAKMRPSEHWREKGIVDVEEFLPEGIRELAKAKVQAYLASIAEGKPAKPDRNRHLNSEYLLTGILRSKQGGIKMSGRKCSNGRKYAVSRGHNVPKSDNVLVKRVFADPIEQALLDMMRIVVNERTTTAKKIKDLINQRCKALDQPDHSADIEKQIFRKKRQFVMLSERLNGDEADDDPIAEKVASVRKEILELESQKRNLKTNANSKPTDPAMSIERLMTDLTKFVKRFAKNNPMAQEDVPHIRQVLNMLVSKLEVDLETNELEIELSLPSWVPEALMHRQVGLDELSTSKPFIEAHPENRLILGVFRCDGQGEPPCFSCRRDKKAA